MTIVINFPLTDVDLDNLLSELDSEPTARCEANHVRVDKVSMILPCDVVASWRAWDSSHPYPRWHFGVNVCNNFKAETELNDSAAPWRWAAI